MGMDVYGKKPISEEGKYFRNNVWWWRPLADYILEFAPQSITRHCKYWHSNDGAGLGQKDSLDLARWLREQLESGAVKEYETQYEAKRAALSKVKCEHCDGTGIRTDAVGVVAGFPDRIVDEDGPRKGEKGYCNACHGHGKHESFDSHYPFSEENVREFAKFVEHSGGFKIC